MDSPHKRQIAGLVRAGRVAKGYTQQELAVKVGITLRSVQRIENGEVLPRAYTLRLLEEQLGIAIPVIGEEPGPEPQKPREWSKGRKWILTISLGLLLPLLTIAYLAQSARWPETDFERFLLWSGVLVIYSSILWNIWK